MKSFTNVHVIFNFAIGKKNKSSHKIHSEWSKGSFFAFLSSSIPYLGKLDDICTSIQICFPVFFLIYTLSPSCSSLATSLHNFLRIQSKLLGKAGPGEAVDLTAEASTSMYVRTATGQLWLRKALM